MKEIKRYDEGGYGTSDMNLSDHGDWVDYDDHAAIVAALQAESDSNLKSAQYSAETNRKVVKKNIELQGTIAALQEQVRALAAECKAVYSHALEEGYQFYPGGIEYTDAALREIRAQAVDGYASELRANAISAKVNGNPITAEFLGTEADRTERFASRIRSGEQP